MPNCKTDDKKTKIQADLKAAKTALAGHVLALCKDEQIFTSDLRGVAPMLDFIDRGVNLSGFSAADVVVGKAAAMLFKKAGVVAVYAKTLSKSGKRYLEENGIYAEYGALTEKIINRAGTDMCPMERAVLEISDAEEGYRAIVQRLSELRAANANANAPKQGEK